MLEHALVWALIHLVQVAHHFAIIPNDFPPPPCGVIIPCG
jgi:hypothetical protein